MPESNYITGKIGVEKKIYSIRSIFGLALLVGTLSIAVGIFSGSPFFFAMLIPLSIIFAFAYIGPRLPNKDLSESKIGDSCYFLGFCMTLISISLSLVYLQGNQEIAISSVIGGFGGAITTTIAGLISRLLLTTLSPSFQSRQERIQEQLDRTVADFTTSIESTVDSINLSLTSIGVTVADANNEINKSYKGSMNDNLKTIGESIDRFAKKLDQIEVSPRLVSDPINKALETLITTISKHNTKISTIYESVSLENMKLSEQIDQSNSLLSSNISKFNSEYEKIVNRQLTHFETKITQASDSIVSGFKNMREIKIETAGDMEKTAASIGSLLRDVKKLLTVDQNIRNTSEEKVNELNQLVTTLTNSMPKLQISIDNLSTPVVDSINEITRFKKELTDMNAALAAMKQLAKDTKNDLGKQKKSIDNATRDLSSDISTLYSTLAVQIQAIREED